jgi:hypothetical protein
LNDVWSTRFHRLTSFDMQRKVPHRKNRCTHTEFKSSLRIFHLNHYLEEADACVCKLM